MALSYLPFRSQRTYVIPGDEGFLGDETLSAPTTAGGVALASVPSGCRHAYLFVTVYPIVLRPSSGALGGAPTGSLGIPVDTGAAYDWTADPTLLKFLGIGGTATVYAIYWGDKFPATT